MMRSDRLAAAALWAATFLIFGAGAPRLGFYYDDSPALATLPRADLRGLSAAIWNYVPGRNLHVLWQYLFLKISSSLTVLHLAQSGLDATVAAVYYALLRRLDLPAPAALSAAALFAFWPTHGETHFWLYAVPQNIVSTLWVLVFALTGDPVSFLAALFTYDQTVFVLLAIAAVRAFGRRRLTDALYLAPVAFFAWLKIVHAPGRGPELRPDALAMLAANVPATISITIGRQWFGHAAAMLGKAAPADWLLAALAAGGLAYVALRLPAGAAPRGRTRLALAGFVAAYLPIWLWHMSQRHHYLPSAALFLAVAAMLARLSARAAAAALAVPVALFAAASRGESRYWEESFARKKELLTGLRPQLHGQEILILEGFPLYHGPAYFITPPDPAFAPRLLFPGSTIVQGDISAVPAPRGVFLRTSLHYYGPEAFRYFPTERCVVVRNGADAPQAVPYEYLSPALGGDGLRREGADAILSFLFPATVPPGRYAAAVVSYRQPGGAFHPWYGPVLLPGAGFQSLRLRSFPPTEGVLVNLYAAGPEGPPRRMGRVELSLEP